MADNWKPRAVDTPGEVVAELKYMMNRGRNEYDSIAALLKRIIEGQMWREYTSPATGMKRGYQSFREFVTDDLKIKKIDTLVGLVESVDAGVAENAKRLWLEEIPASGKVGRPTKEQKKVSNSQFPSKDRNRADSLLARLKRDHPDLAQQVINGDISATKAAREAGIITPTIRLGKPATVAAKLRDHYNEEDLAELARLICE